MTCELTDGKGAYKGTLEIPAEVEYNNRKFKVIQINSALDYYYIESLSIPNTINTLPDIYYDAPIKELIIQDGDNSIQMGSVRLMNLKKLYMGRNIDFDSSSFPNMEEVSIGPLVTSIGRALFYDSFFYGGSSISTITFSKDSKLTEIGEKAFFYCKCSTIALPNSVETIGEKAFGYSSKLKKIELPNSLKSIGDYAFFGCPLTDIVFPSELKHIGEKAFSGCSITEIRIPQNVKYIGEKSFGENPLSRIYFEDTDETISLFSNSFPSVESVYIGRNFTGTIQANNIEFGPSVNKLNAANFKGSKNLKSISIPTSVKTIGDDVFSGCSSLETLEIPSLVTYIGTSAFKDCSNLKSISFGSNIKDIGSGALTGCKNLSEITLFSAVPPGYHTEFTNKQYMDIIVNVPNGSLSAYQNADIWKNFWNITEMAASGITKIGADNVCINANANTIIITGAEADDLVTVVGIDGRIRYTGYDKIIYGLTPGLYIVKVRNCIQKAVVR